MPGNVGFGTAGLQAYNEDLRGGINSVEALGRIAMQPAQQQLLESHARLYGAQALEKEQDAAAQAEMARLLKLTSGPEVLPEGVQGPPAPAGVAGGVFSMADRFDKVAIAASGAGNVKAAEAAAKTATYLRQHEEQTRVHQTTRRLNELKTIKERSQLMGQLFGGAVDEASWRRANALFEFQTGAPSPYAGMQYNPDLVDTINAQALETKEALDLEEKRLTREETKRYRNSRLSQHDRALALREDALEIEREREERLKKAGGKGAAGAPTSEELNQVKALMRLDGIDVSKFSKENELASLRSKAFSIGSRARELQQENRALGRAQALQRAYQEAKENGELEVETLGGTEVPVVGNVGGERRFATVLPKAARAALSEGKETTFRNGQVWTLDGGKPKRVR